MLFNGKARCVSCHQLNPSNPLGTDNRFHNIGVVGAAPGLRGPGAPRRSVALQKNDGLKAIDELALSTDMSELGRFMVTKNRSDIGGFRTSQLRNIGITGPYMHDGSMQTLWDVMDHYNKGGEANPFLDGGIEPLALSEDEIDAVVALMFTHDRSALRRAEPGVVREATRHGADAAAVPRQRAGHAPGAAVRAARHGPAKPQVNAQRGRAHETATHVQEHRDAPPRGARGAVPPPAQPRSPHLHEGVDGGRRGGGGQGPGASASRSCPSTWRTARPTDEQGFRIAYISDSHLYDRNDQRPLRAPAAARRRRRQRPRSAARLRPLRRRSGAARPAERARRSARRSSRTSRRRCT